jgi:hypothetical protein
VTGGRRARRAIYYGAVAVALAGVWPGTAGAIVGGQQLPIEQAPWTVHVTATNEYGTNTCTGSIIDATRVLTAAHCVQRLGGEPPPSVTVVAGTSNVGDPRQGQRIPAAAVRGHPYGRNGLDADDVAVVTLQRPLNLSGPAAQAIPLVAPGPPLPVGTSVTAIGFGAQSPTGQPNGLLYALGHVLVDPYLGIHSSCAGLGSEAAVTLCPLSDAGAICFGDSGGPLVAGSPPVLVGVASRGTGVSPGSSAGESCEAGKASGFVNLSAPEIRAFIDGSDQPPLAPRFDGYVLIDRKGSRRRPRLVCESPAWRNAPTLTYSWLDAASGKTLATGPSYAIRRRDKGRSILCAVTATNPGGTVTRPTSPSRITKYSVPVLTQRQKLRRALRACAERRSRAARARCRRAAHRRFG